MVRTGAEVSEEPLSAVPDTADLARTPLYDLHHELGARMVPFAGTAMPVQYPAGIIAEHNHTRAAASLFDVSHMGQVTLEGDEAAIALETLVCGDIRNLEPGRMRYTLFTNHSGGILDDLMVTNAGEALFLVVNAAVKDADVARLREGMRSQATVEFQTDRGLLALQGPKAVDALAQIAPDCAALKFMRGAAMHVDGVPCHVTRSGYTGEDGFEISCPAEAAEEIARALLAQDEVEPAGLGARDSLRLEAGLCLYGHDIDETTTPVEAGLAWTIQKSRRKEGGFPGFEVIDAQLHDGPPRKRVGLRPEGKAPAREGAEIRDKGGKALGAVTSGGFGPTVGGPVAMGYVAAEAAEEGTEVDLIVRGKAVPAHVAALPFVKRR